MVHWKCHIPSHQTPIILLSDPIRFQRGAFLSDSSIQFDSIRCQPASYRNPARPLPARATILNASSFLKQHTSSAAQPTLIFVLTLPLVLQGAMLHGTFYTPSYHILTRLPSHPYHIPLRRLFSFLSLMSLPTRFPIIFPTTFLFSCLNVI